MALPSCGQTESVKLLKLLSNIRILLMLLDSFSKIMYIRDIRRTCDMNAMGHVHSNKVSSPLRSYFGECQKFLSEIVYIYSNFMANIHTCIRNTNEPGHEKMCLMSNANYKGADQPAHPRSLISAFVVRCLDSIISLDSIAEIS